jgi:hypothetical protein
MPRLRQSAPGFTLLAFEFKVTDDIDECSNNTRHMMLWIDVPANEREENDVARFAEIVDGLVGETPPTIGIVALDHVPAKFGDFGDSASALSVMAYRHG